jgi:hypothetical protein
MALENGAVERYVDIAGANRSEELLSSMALIGVLSAWMPAQDGTATPSKGGREGIVGTGMSRRPEANWRNASFLYYSFAEKRIIRRNHQPSKRDNFDQFFKQANGTMATSPSLFVGDSFLLRRRAKGEAAKWLVT